jgi:hypothetical protein
MIFGNKSDLKNHLSAKHPTFSHKVMARGTYDQSVEPMHQKERSPEKDPPPKTEAPEVGRPHD